MGRDSDSNREAAARLVSLLRGYQRLVIVGHDNPDPDYLASALALRFLARSLAGIPAVITVGGIVGRAENRAMARILKIHLTPMAQAHFASRAAVALIDTQPGTGNNSLPATVLPQIVIDHHPRRRSTNAPVVDIRPEYGATSTILSGYLQSFAVELPAALATALAYGIASETLDLSREAGEADIASYLATLGKANKRLLAEIIHPKVSRYYFTAISRALKSAFYYRTIIGARLGEVSLPDVIAQVADLLLSHERMSWAICTGFWGDQLFFSVRSSNPRARLGSMARKMVARRGTAGGHDTVAAGQIDCHALLQAERLRLEEGLLIDFMHRITHQKEIEPKPLITKP